VIVFVGMKKTVKNTKKGAIESILDTLNSIKSAMVTKKEHHSSLESIKSAMVTKKEHEGVLETVASIKSAMVTKKEHEAVLETVEFIKDRMVTKSELAEVRTELKKDIEDTRLELRSKIDGVHRRIDEDLDKRKTLENRMSRIEARA